MREGLIDFDGSEVLLSLLGQKTWWLLSRPPQITNFLSGENVFTDFCQWIHKIKLAFNHWLCSDGRDDLLAFVDWPRACTDFCFVWEDLLTLSSLPTLPWAETPLAFAQCAAPNTDFRFLRDAKWKYQLLLQRYGFTNIYWLSSYRRWENCLTDFYHGSLRPSTNSWFWMGHRMKYRLLNWCTDFRFEKTQGAALGCSHHNSTNLY